MRTRVKICGITRFDDAAAVVEHGADAIGFVFYERSPRNVAIERAAEIVRRLPPYLTTVGLFVNAEDDLVRRVIETVGIDLLQFHGDEPPEVCQRYARPWMRAIRMKPGTDLMAQRQAYGEGRGLLLDAYMPGVPGGTGETFNWDLIPPELAGEIVLAGGLNANNVGDAIRRVRPYAVDVSGGVEAEKGIKDPLKIKAFIEEVRRAQI